MPVQKLCILGSTGSIGTQALEVCQDLGIKVNGISCRRNIKLAEQQVRRFSPDYVCVVDEACARDLRSRISDTATEVIGGTSGLVDLVGETDCDTVLNALVGMVGLIPTLAALECGRDVALANKETLVAGGKLVTGKLRETGRRLIPVDSEHSAIFQCLQDRQSAPSLRRILLTCSGGPFFGKKKEELEGVTAEQALAHPNWSMGNKITVDSATLMNKAFEVIEAMWLFGMKPDDIDVVVHRQSILHSGVEFEDGAVLAQLGMPDMRLPIQYALTYPERKPCKAERLDILKIACLTFEEPDTETFECLRSGMEAARRDGLAPCAVNAGNEVAVGAFLEGKIGFLDIGRTVTACLENAPVKKDYTLNELLEADAAARELARGLCGAKA